LTPRRPRVGSTYAAGAAVLSGMDTANFVVEMVFGIYRHCETLSYSLAVRMII
jgi:hypothetical protein